MISCIDFFSEYICSISETVFIPVCSFFFCQRSVGHNISITTGDSHKMDVQELGWKGIDWIGLMWLAIGTGGGQW